MDLMQASMKELKIISRPAKKSTIFTSEMKLDKKKLQEGMMAMAPIKARSKRLMPIRLSGRSPSLTRET